MQLNSLYGLVLDKLASSLDERTLNHPHVVGEELQTTVLPELFCDEMF